MNCKTRREKIGEAMAEVKRMVVITLLCAWAILTMALGVCYGMESKKVEQLESKIAYLEEMSQKNRTPSANYDVIYVERR